MGRYDGWPLKDPRKDKAYSTEEIKEVVNSKRESGKKRTVEDEPFQLDYLE